MPSLKSRLAWADASVSFALVSSAAANACPAVTVSPALTEIAVTVPLLVGKLTATVLMADRLPLADTVAVTVPRATVAVGVTLSAVVGLGSPTARTAVAPVPMRARTSTPLMSK